MSRLTLNATFTFFFMFFEISIISFNSSIDSAFNCLIFLLIANSISSFCFPTPENMISFGFTETDKHFFN